MNNNLDVLLESYFVKDYDSLKHYQSLTEEDKKILSKGLVTKLFNTIKNKTMKIDYYGIEQTKGDITKYNHYDDINNSIKILTNMYNSHPDPSYAVITRLKNTEDILLKYKSDFVKAFKQKNEVVTLTYTNVYASLIAATGRIISTVLDYIKHPNNEYEISFKKINKGKLDKDVYFKALDHFIKMEKKGDLKKILDIRNLNEALDLGYTENNDEVLSEFGFGSIIAIGSIAITIIILLFQIIKKAVFGFYFGRTKIADYLLAISYFLEEHANSLDSNNKKNKKVKERQLRTVEKLRSLSSKIAVNDEKSDKVIEEESKKADKELTSTTTDSGSDDSNNSDDDVLL